MDTCAWEDSEICGFNRYVVAAVGIDMKAVKVFTFIQETAQWSYKASIAREWVVQA